MTQRIRNGLGLPAGLYRTNGGGPVVFVPNGITADGVDSIVYSDVTPVSGGYDYVVYDSVNDRYIRGGNPNPSATHFNKEIAVFFDDILRTIFNAAQPEGDFPYKISASESRAKIVDDLATLQVDFFVDPDEV